MSSRLDPLILKKLQAFSQRRRKLIILRGILSAAATLLVTMMLVAMADWIFVLPDGIRWALSAAAYITILVVEWRSCVRLLIHAPGPQRLARLVESAAPDLREDLLSAVELGGASPGAIYDSEQFRALLQSNVASRMERIDMDRLLPVNLVRRSGAILAAVAAVCLIAFAFTGLQFGTLMARALLPMANLARVSKVQVHIVEPNPAEGRIPQGDTIPLVIEISGQRTNKAFLETFTQLGGRQLIQMQPASANRFSATIQVGREDVVYRVRAGDAITSKHRLQAVARPAVIAFTKTYIYPTYSRLPKKEVTEENGDLAALEGTRVELRLKTNQKISKAGMRVEQGKKSSTVPLTEQDGMLAGSLTLNASGVYRVQLVGAASGFENKFSPEFELRAEPDLAPQVELELPKQDLILPPNEIVEVEGEASDDLALAKVSQLVKINDGKWKETVLQQEPGAKTKIQQRWDLFEQGVKPGDLVTMKLVATDLKGTRAESRPLQVTITAGGFEVKRMQALDSQRQLYQALQAFQAASEKLAQRGKETREQFERAPENDPARKEGVVAAAGALEDSAHAQSLALDQLFITLKKTDAGHESSQIALLGQILAKAQSDLLSVRAALNLLNRNPATPLAVERMREVESGFSRIHYSAVSAEGTERSFLAQEEIDVLNENLRIVAQEQERLNDLAKSSGDDPQKWAQISNRQRVIVSETRSMEELMEAATPHTPNGGGGRLRDIEKRLNKQRVLVDQEMTASRPPGMRLAKPVGGFATALKNSAREAMDLKASILNVPVQAFNRISNEAQPIYTRIETLRPEIEALQRNKKLAEDAQAALIGARWDARQAFLKTRGDVEEARPDADAYFIQDIRTTARALEGVRGSEVNTTPESLSTALAPLAKDMRLLETAHHLLEIVDGLNHLAAGERWEIYNPRARTGASSDWQWSQEMLRVAPDELSRALIADDVRDARNAAREALWKALSDPSKQHIDQEMSHRCQQDYEPQSMSKEAEQLAALVKNALELLRKPIDDARKELAQLAPTVSQLASQLAKETEKVKAQTQEAAQKTPDQKREDSKADAQQSLAQQQTLNDKVESLKDALRADANQQNILKKDGQERARDADDALAMLKEPPARAEEDLERATQNDEPTARQDAMKQAAAQQEKLENALQKVAQHYDNVEKGKEAEESRMALRATEQPNGVKEQLDQEFAKAAKLAEMAEATPLDLLSQLEKALPKNPQMRQELSAISRNTLTGAENQLRKASTQESAVAGQVSKLASDQAEKAAQQAPAQQAAAQPNPTVAPAQPPQAAQNAPTPKPENKAETGQAAANTPRQESKTPQTAQAQTPSQATPAASPPVPDPALAQAAQQQAPIGQTANDAGNEVARAGRHESRLENTKPGEELQRLGKQIQDTAQQQVPDAQKALEQARQAAQASPAVNAADRDLKGELGQLASAAKQSGAAQPPQAPKPPQQASNANAPQPSQNQAAAPNAARPDGQGTASHTAAPVAPLPNEQPNAPQAKGLDGEEGKATEIATAQAPAQQQVWMARTLDALDAALHSDTPPAPDLPGNQKSQPSQSQSGSGQQPGQQPGDMAKAQAAMKSAAQAAAASMRASRSQTPSETPGGPMAQGGEQAASKGGAQVQAAGMGHSALSDAKNQAGEWGKLPKKMAEQLSQGRQEAIPGEYRNQVETYYRVIAEKAKKQ